jgi:hypothetical protein
MPASRRAHATPPALNAVLRPSAKRGGRAAMARHRGQSVSIWWN